MYFVQAVAGCNSGVQQHKIKGLITEAVRRSVRSFIKAAEAAVKVLKLK